MANRLKMTVVQSILSLHAQHWSQHRIADTLEIDRGTVARHIRRAALAAQPDPAGISNAANAPIDPARVGGGLKSGHCADRVRGGGPGGRNGPGEGGLRRCRAAEQCRAVARVHSRRARQGLSAKRIHQDLVAEFGVAGTSYDSVRRLLKRLGAVRPLPMRRMECEAGQEAQVDFGTGAGSRRPKASGGRRMCFAWCSPIPARLIARRAFGRRPRTSCGCWRTLSGTSAECRRPWSSTISRRPCCVPIGSTRI